MYQSGSWRPDALHPWPVEKLRMVALCPHAVPTEVTAEVGPADVSPDAGLCEGYGLTWCGNEFLRPMLLTGLGSAGSPGKWDTGHPCRLPSTVELQKGKCLEQAAMAPGHFPAAFCRDWRAKPGLTHAQQFAHWWASPSPQQGCLRSLLPTGSRGCHKALLGQGNLVLVEEERDLPREM